MFESIDQARNEIRENFVKDNKPWIISYSGGKDSTLLLQLVLEVALEKQIKKELYVIFSDTGIEQDGISERVAVNFANIEKFCKQSDLLLKTAIIKPSVPDRFFNCIVGYGYCSPYPPMMRWCTDRLKRKPIKYWKRDNLKTEYITVTGERFDESPNRKKRMLQNLEENGFFKEFVFRKTKKGGVRKRRVNEIGEMKYCPIRNVGTKELWLYLSSLSKFYWNEDFKTLMNQYNASNVDEIISQNKERRSGCRFCTFSNNKNHSPCAIENEYMAKISDFTEHRPDKRNLIVSSRIDSVYNTPGKFENNKKILNGEIATGCLTIEARSEVLNIIREMEQKTGRVWITREDEEFCRQKWIEDEQKIKSGYLVDARNVLKTGD